MKIFFIGSDTSLSLQPLRYLLRSSHDICGIGLGMNRPAVSHQQARSIPTQSDDSLSQLAQACKLPIVDMLGVILDVMDNIDRLNPDVILVSCYAHKLDDQIIELARHGAFNIHPSLLPAYRGPTPIFWQFRDGVERYGLSLHRMTSSFDAGAIITAVDISLADGLSLPEASNVLAEQTIPLLEAALPLIESGDDGADQCESDASYQTYPSAKDFSLSSEWTARRIYNFMRATAHMGLLYECRYAAINWRLRHALAYSKDGQFKSLLDTRDVLRIPCTSGFLAATYHQ